MADKKITIKQYTGTGTNYDTLYPATTATQISYSNSNVQAVVDELYTSVKDGKTQIATAITSKGQNTSSSDTFATMTANIRNIQTFKPEQDKTAYANGWIYPDEGMVLSSVSVAIPVYDGSIKIPTFNKASWNFIKTAATSGEASSYWSVGDRKEVILNGTVGDKVFSNTTTYCYILGFDHNTSIESNGEHTIHIGFGATALSGGNYIAYVDSQYDGYVSTTGYFSMNSSNTNKGGWKQCQMRTNICPAFKNALPSDLKSVIRSVTKYQNQGGASSAGESQDDEIFLMSEMEIFGQNKLGGYIDNQAQYDFYKDVANGGYGASKVRCRDTSTSKAVFWWGRSARSAFSDHFCYVAPSGSGTSNAAHGSYGFAPCLCL